MGRKKIIILDNAGSAYLSGTKTAVTISSRSMIAEPDRDPISLIKKDPKTGKETKYLGVVPWGEDNTFPQNVMESCKYSPQATSALLFLISLGYGDGIAYGRWQYNAKGQKEFIELFDEPKINEFFENNDIQGYLLEQITDMMWFYNIFPEIGLSPEKKIVELHSKEASFSRWEKMNPDTGLIGHHFYSGKWQKAPASNEIEVTPVLNPHNPALDLKIRMGLIADPKTTKTVKDPKDYRFIIPTSFPTPGRSYYQKAYWLSVIDSGWLDYARKIPEFKNALMDNQMTIKYHVELSSDYFTEIFKSEGITEDEAKKSRIKKEYSDLDKFLSSTKNTGKSVISFVKYSADGKEMRRMKITAIENNFKGGEFIDDSEEASNMISYGFGVHQGIIGSSPGKNKTISGTEARELFIIKQALMKPFRDRILRPLYVIKQFNGWPADIHFEIPNMTLTTLDRGTGSEKVIS